LTAAFPAPAEMLVIGESASVEEETTGAMVAWVIALPPF